MGKKGTSSSWLTAVKRAFRSPTKDNTEKVRNQRRKHDQQPQEQEQEQEQEQDFKEKKEKRGTWLFTRKSTTNQEPITGNNGIAVSDEHKNAIAIAMATAAAAEAAVATAQAAMEAARIAGPVPNPNRSSKYHYAAVVIQTAFRGYLARRALGALKGIVRLQALVRGHNVRKQAKMTLRCMQALVRVQSRVLDQRLRQTTEGIRNSSFSDTTSMIDSLYLQEISDRRSMSKEGSGIPDGRGPTVDGAKAVPRRRKEAFVKHQRNLSQTYSEQMWRTTGRNSSIGSEKELGEQHQWLDRWMATKAWDNRGRASTDQRRVPNKTVEMDTIPQLHSCLPPQHQRPSSPRRRPNQNSPSTPTPSKARSLQVRSASPRFSRDERSNRTSQTPSLRSNYHYTGALRPSNGVATPNYMAATESAKARVRSQSAPRQRAATPERDMSGTKKRLSYPEPYNVGNAYCNMRSPSFKSVIEHQSNYSSCRTESIAEDASPSTASDQFIWLR